jgi:hypothetical protein
MKMTRPLANDRTGLTLLELCISMVLLAMLMGSVGIVMNSGSGAYHQGMTSANLESHSRRGIDRVAEQFGDAGRDTLNPLPLAPLGTERLDFRRSTGAVGGVIQWGPTQRIEFRYDVGEVNDGNDNDNDGLIDEGRVVLIENLGLVNETTRTLCPDVAEFLDGEVPNGADDNGNGLVDEGGFVLEMSGETLVIRMTLQDVDNEGREITNTVETSVWIRN